MRKINEFIKIDYSKDCNEPFCWNWYLKGILRGLVVTGYALVVGIILCLIPIVGWFIFAPGLLVLSPIYIIIPFAYPFIELAFIKFKQHEIDTDRKVYNLIHNRKDIS